MNRPKGLAREILEDNVSWKKCSNCKKSIEFGSTYYACSVSTCNRERTGLFFCSVSCWSGHVPIMRHRDAWAVEEKAPLTEDGSGPAAPMVRFVSSPGVAPSPASSSAAVPDDVLVVVSKLKAYIKAKADMNTAADVVDELSERLRRLCDDAVVRARNDGRKTVMARDF